MHPTKVPAVIILLLITLFQRQPGMAARMEKTSNAPSGFVDEVVATLGSGDIPTGLALTPDGRVLIGLKSGVIRVVENGTLLAQPALTLSAGICTDGERGLESIAVDPDFANTRYIYVYQTAPAANNSCTGAVNRVLRYTLTNNIASTPLILLDNIPTGGGYHNGGDLKFGADGLLYVSVGDGGSQLGGGANGANNDNARNRSILNGKILRIARDGTIPASNPYVNTGGSVICSNSAPNKTGGWCRETFAWGLRNPFRMAFKNGTNTFYINDVGQNAWEEINLGVIGADYGWNTREGRCAANSTTNCGNTPAGMTDPIYSHDHNGMCSITGGAFSTNAWAPPYGDAYFFGDYCNKTIYQLTPNTAGGFTESVFHTPTSAGGIVSMLFDQNSRALYYTLSANYANSSAAGIVRRVRSTTAVNRAPEAVASATVPQGLAPISVAFDGRASSDPDADALSYNWNFGDGATGNGATVSHSYAQNGRYTATLTVRDGANLASEPVAVPIVVGNAVPVPVIQNASSPTFFRVGELLTMRGSATDAEDGQLGGAALSWRVLLHHVADNNQQNEHTHPYFTGNGISVTLPPMPAPEDLAATQFSYIEVQLTATDSQNQSRTVTHTLRPRRVPVTLNSQPPGLQISANEATFTAPTTFTAWDGMSLQLNADDAQNSSSGAWRFENWSSSTARVHTLIVPSVAVTYTASYREIESAATPPPGVLPTATPGAQIPLANPPHKILLPMVRADGL